MIKDKSPKIVIHYSGERDISSEPELVDQNALSEMYQAVKRALMTIREDPDNPESAAFFKTIALDTGQFLRIIRDDNREMEIAFPAVFIHYTNVRYLVQQQRIGQGRATLRIRYVLNTLNNQDEDRECDPFVVFQRVNVAVQDAKSYEPALTERCNLLYFDMPTTTNMLQAYWVDYEVWFRETSAWKYRDWVPRYVVMPPFTDHGDAPERDEDGHGGHPEVSVDDAVGIADVVEEVDSDLV